MKKIKTHVIEPGDSIMINGVAYEAFNKTRPGRALSYNPFNYIIDAELCGVPVRLDCREVDMLSPAKIPNYTT